jgi:tricorn protease
VVIDEAWRALDRWFYDPNFHGVDWPAQLEKYRPWALEASSEDDFSDVVNLMIGEINASHMGYYPRRAADGETTGFIGAFFDPTAGGPGMLVREVLPDAPAARHDVNLAAGERILRVNGHGIEPSDNIYRHFADTVGQRVQLQITGADGTTRTATVVPITSQEQAELRYRQWVRQRRELTREYSDDRLGYIHIQGMDLPSFEEFERGLYAAAEGKEGLVIDVRSNGGGWTTDYLLTALMVERHAYTVPRASNPDERAYPTAERLLTSAWTRPAVTLCNEDSYSNAEIFSHAFKTLGRGELVGMPTFGAVISTDGTTVMNGALVRLPMRGWYVAGSGVNMELNGAVPDVIVEQPPAEDSSAAEDTQLRRAVEVLLNELPNDPRRDAW